MLPIRNKTNVIFDFEVFPEWWGVCFRRVSDPEDTWEITSETKEYKRQLLETIRDYRLIGFNIKAYDLLILNAIVCDLRPTEVYQVSEDIIHDVRTTWTATFNHYRWDWIDVFNDWKDGSLKMYEANSGMSIVETSIPFGKKNLTDEEKREILTYCYHDTYATYKLWLARRDYFGIHEFVSKRYGLPLKSCLQKTMQSLTAAAMQAEYSKDIYPEDKRDDIYCLDYISEHLDGVDPFKYLLSLDDQTERTFIHDGDRFNLGVGGIHSDYGHPVIAKSDDEKTVWTMDFTQYYPNMLIKFKLLSRTVPKQGWDIYADMIEKVKSLKVAMNEETDPDKKKAMKSERDKYKVLINSVSGAMRSKYSKFYDPTRIITMCTVGQFLLIAITADIKKSFPGTELLQTNTDGAYFLVPNKYDFEAKLNEIMDKLHFDIEVEKAKMLVQRDVNNYLLVESDGKVKSKGRWSSAERDKLKPASYAVSRKAVFNFLLYGTPIEETIRDDKDIMDFVTCSKTGSTFDYTIYRTKPQEFVVVGKGKDRKVKLVKPSEDDFIKTSNTNRFVAVTDVKYGQLMKVSDGDNYSESIVPDCPAKCKLLNDDISTYNFDDLHIDYDFYIAYSYGLLPNFYSI